MENQTRLQNLFSSEDFHTFAVMENLPVGAVSSNSVNTGTDLDEYNQWMKTQTEGVGEIGYDDPDDARDIAEFAALSGNDEING